MATYLDPLAAVAEPIRTRMRDHGSSVNSLATATLIPYSTLRRKLHDPELLTMGDLLRIATALGVAPADVLPAPLISTTATAA